MANGEVFKNINDSTDVRAVRRQQNEELFSVKKALVKPFSSASNIEITTSSVFTENSNIYNSISFVNISGSGETYFSYMRAQSSSYANASGSGMSYRQLISLSNFGYTDKYQFNDDITSDISEKIDIISVSREYYRDSINPNNFAVFVNTGSSTPSSSVSAFNIANGIHGLYPNTDKSYDTPMGKKYYLYFLDESIQTTLYNNSTDELYLPSLSDLEIAESPYGELFADSGIVLLYADKLKQKYANINDSSALHYVAGVGGASFTELSGTIYFVRMFNNEFNYTNNPTFLEDNASGLIKEKFRVNPVTYVTGVGLFNSNKELIAFGRPSSPLKKSFDNEYIFKLELNY